MINISATKRNFLGLLALFTVICGGVGAVILNYALPGYYFGEYPFIPVYFFLLGALSIYAFDLCRRQAPKKLLLMYMAMKVMKLLFTIIVLLVYCVVIRTNEKEFLLTFGAFYLMYLIYETWFFFVFEWNRKTKKQKTI